VHLGRRSRSADDSTEITLHSIFRCDILNIERGKPEIHGLPSTMTNYMLYSISRSLFAVVGGYFLPLKISYMRLARETNKIPIWIRSEYVTYIGIALLSSLVWRVSPSDDGG
jgi:hypothetical protein